MFVCINYLLHIFISLEYILMMWHCVPNETAKWNNITQISATIFRTMNMGSKKNDINIIITIMGKNIKFQFALPYKCCFYVNYLRRLIQLIYETRHPHVRRLWFCRYEIVDNTYYTRTFYKGYTCKTFLNRTSF